MNESDSLDSATRAMPIATIDLLDVPDVAGHRGPPIERTLRGVRVEGLSSIGFSFVSSQPIAIATLVQIDLGGEAEATARIVEQAGDSYRCVFIAPLSAGGSEARWPRGTRAAIYLIGGGAAWFAAIAIFNALR